MPLFLAVPAAAATYSSHMTQTTLPVTSSTAAPFGPSSLQPLNNEPPAPMHGNLKPQTEARFPVTALQTAKFVSQTANSTPFRSSSQMFVNQYLGQTSLPGFISPQTTVTKHSSTSQTGRKFPLVSIEIPTATASITSTKPIKKGTRSTTSSTVFHRSLLPRSLQPKCPTE